MFFNRVFCSLALLSLAICGCETYQARPLATQDIIDKVERARHFIDEPVAGNSRPESTPSKEVSFTRAATLMAEHNPALKEADAEYQSALALAHVKTPLPNPSVEVGPRFGFGTDVIRRRVEPFGSIGFAIPTGKRLKRMDELNRINAEAAHVEYVAKYRETYLALRKAYAELALSRMRMSTRKTILEAADKTSALNKKNFESGQITAADTVLFDLEAGRIKGESMDMQLEIAGTEATLADLVGVSADVLRELPEVSQPGIPAAIPSNGELIQILTANHLELARIRMKYEVAEAELRLEIARQYPDFKFGTSGEGDINDRKTLLGLTLGIDIPIFDRNQQGIAAAKGKRDAVRAKYEAAANRALSGLERARRLVELTSEKLNFLRQELLPKANQSVELSQKAVDAGAIDSFRVLENQRAQRAVLLSIVDAELALRRAWVDLEQAVGHPMMLFPEEKQDALPILPDTAKMEIEK